MENRNIWYKATNQKSYEGITYMKRVIIIGSGGAGKSTLARKLGEVTNLPVIHLDSVFWKPNWTPTPKEEWKEIVEQLIMKDEWIIDGNFGSTMDLRIQRADTIILLDLHPLICVYSVIKRVLKHRNKTRPDMGENCPEKADFEFLRWVWTFRKKSLPSILRKLDEAEGKTIIRLKSRKEIDQFVKELD